MQLFTFTVYKYINVFQLTDFTSGLYDHFVFGMTLRVLRIVDYRDLVIVFCQQLKEPSRSMHSAQIRPDPNHSERCPRIAQLRNLVFALVSLNQGDKAFATLGQGYTPIIGSRRDLFQGNQGYGVL